jgi:hypothetical protein
MKSGEQIDGQMSSQSPVVWFEVKVFRSKGLQFPRGSKVVRNFVNVDNFKKLTRKLFEHPFHVQESRSSSCSFLIFPTILP